MSKNLVKKTGYDTKIIEIETKFTDHDHSNEYITTQKFKSQNVIGYLQKILQGD